MCADWSTMTYTFYELLWFYLLYSFIGWCLEVCGAVISRRKFVNRGFITSPLCPIYGTGAISFCLFLPELKQEPFFLFLGGVILASVIEFSTGKLLEKFTKRKWWDYSGEHFSLDGYICLKYSLLWGILALVLLYVGNPLLQSLLALLPHTIGNLALIILYGLLLLDFICACCTVLGMRLQTLLPAPLSDLTEGMSQASRLLENAITRKIRKRMEKAFPTMQAPAASPAEAEKSTVFAEGCSFYKLVSLFFIGAFLGDITETVFCLLTTGRLMSRSSVVYGPFSIVWGLGCALLTAFLYRYRNKSDRHIFLAGTLLGGAYEYICSVFTELVFGTVFWDYSGFTFNLGGRINLLYCFFWGIAAVVWLKIIYPRLSDLIEKIPKKAGTILVNVLLVFMLFNMGISALALARYTERNTTAVTASAPAAEHASDTDGTSDAAGAAETDRTSGSTTAAETGSTTADKDVLSLLNHFLDTRFPDERMERIYPNAKIVEE